MKKIIIGLLLLGLIGILVVNVKEEKISNVNRIYSEYKNNVDGGIEKLLNSDEYINETYEKKVESVLKLLKLYEESGLVNYIYFDEDSSMYTFQYQDGILGGIKLKEFDHNLN